MIELLTVIAIIGSLAGLLFPVLGVVREKARRAACASNLHQVFLGIGLYAADNSRYVPYLTTPTDYANCSFVLLNTYIQTAAIFYCPSDRRTGPPAGAAKDFSNANFRDAANVCSYSLARQMALVPDFHDLPVVVDRVGTGVGPAMFNLMNPTNGAATAVWTNGNHRANGGNILFVDGRVQFVSQLPTNLQSATAYQTSTPNTLKNAVQNPR